MNMKIPRHVLIDTCVFINLIKYPLKTRELFESFLEDDAVLCINDFIYYELIRGANNKTMIDDYNDFMTRRYIHRLPLDPNLRKNYEEILPLYNVVRKNSKKNKGYNFSKITLTDVLNVACLHHYKDKICMLTNDIWDYPPDLCTREKIVSIDFNNSIQTFAMYMYQPEGIDELRNRFKQVNT